MSEPVSIVVQLAAFIGDFESLLRSIVFLIGLILILHALRLAGRRFDIGGSSVPMAKIFMSFCVGAALMAFPQWVAILLSTFFGSNRVSDSSDLLAYGGNTVTSIQDSGQAIEAIVSFIQLIGFIAIARGLLFLNDAVSPNGGSRLWGPGITFIVSGTLAVNFPTFFSMMANMFAELH